MPRICKILMLERIDYMCVECGRIMMVNRNVNLPIEHLVLECTCPTMIGRKFKVYPKCTQGVEIEDNLDIPQTQEPK